MTVKTFVKGELTVRKVIGNYTVDEMLSFLAYEYRKCLVRTVGCKYWVWDMSEAHVKGLQVNDLSRIIDCVLTYGKDVRTGGKTAVIAPGHLNYGMGRLLDTYAYLGKLPFEVATFQTKKEAEKWLGMDIPDVECGGAE